MINEIEKSFKDFMSSLSDETHESVIKQIKCPLLELMDSQANVDQAKKDLFKKEIGLLLKLYLSRISLSDLSAKMESHEKIFKRAFGQDRFNHLKLLVKLKMLIEKDKPKRGLLAG